MNSLVEIGLRRRESKPERRPLAKGYLWAQNKPYIGEVIFDTMLSLDIGRAGQPIDSTN